MTLTPPAPTVATAPPTHPRLLPPSLVPSSDSADQDPTGNDGWLHPRALVDADRPELRAALELVAERWSCRPAVAAALWWKRYSWYVVAAALDAWWSGEIPELGLDRCWVRLDRASGSVEIRPASGATRPSTDGPAQCARWLRTHVLDTHLADVVTRLHELTRVGVRPLWGSVAHAVAVPVANRMPDPVVATPRFLRWVGVPVAGLVSVTRSADGSVRVARRTCCLAFRGSCGGQENQPPCPYCPIMSAPYQPAG